MQVPDQQISKMITLTSMVWKIQLLIEYTKAKTISNGPFNEHYAQFIMVTS